MRALPALALLILAACPRPTASAGPAATGLEPFEEEGRWGYKNAAGQTVIEPTFNYAGAFNARGIAPVNAKVGDASYWGYIDRRGELLVKAFDFDNGPDEFVEGLARCIDGGQPGRGAKFGFFDEDGRVVIAPRWDYAEPFADGKAAVCMGCQREDMGEHWRMVGGQWGAIDKTGELVVPLAERPPQ